jgi:hypothetical protein
MDLSSSWIDVNATTQTDECLESPSSSTCLSFFALPPFAPNFAGPEVPVRTVSAMQQGLHNADGKAELHRVLQSVQCSSDFGIYFCESFRDPRRHYIDDYWNEVAQEAVGLEDLHRLVGRADNAPLTDEARARLHQFARLLDRLARRIDRVVLA